MINTTPTDVMRSAGIVMEEELLAALDDLRDLMTEDGVTPSRSEIARSLLWAGMALIRSSDPRAGELLRLVSLDPAMGD